MYVFEKTKDVIWVSWKGYSFKKVSTYLNPIFSKNLERSQTSAFLMRGINVAAMRKKSQPFFFSPTSLQVDLSLKGMKLMPG